MSVQLQAEQWKLIGNAVSVDVARWIGECLNHPWRYKYTAGAQDQPFKKPQQGDGEALEVECQDQVVCCMLNQSAGWQVTSFVTSS